MGGGYLFGEPHRALAPQQPLEGRQDEAGVNGMVVPQVVHAVALPALLCPEGRRAINIECHSQIFFNLFSDFQTTYLHPP